MPTHEEVYGAYRKELEGHPLHTQTLAVPRMELFKEDEGWDEGHRQNAEADILRILDASQPVPGAESSQWLDTFVCVLRLMPGEDLLRTLSTLRRYIGQRAELEPERPSLPRASDRKGWENLLVTCKRVSHLKAHQAMMVLEQDFDRKGNIRIRKTEECLYWEPKAPEGPLETVDF